MGMEQIVIQKFLRALDETDLRRAEAMDEAIRVCSDGKYTTFQDLIDNYLRDLQNYGGDNRSTYWNIDDFICIHVISQFGISGNYAKHCLVHNMENATCQNRNE